MAQARVACLWHTGPQVCPRRNAIPSPRTAIPEVGSPHRRLVERQIEDILTQTAPRRSGDGVVRRVVSVLAVEIEGFVALCESMEPPGVATMLDLYISAVADSVGTYLGTVHGHLGSTVLASWNATFLQPDHAALAVSAALDIAARVDDVNRRLEGLPAISSAAGINTGDAVVRRLDGVSREEEPVGDAVNVALILARCAAAGETLIGEGTRVSLGSEIRVEPLDDLKLRGKQRPLRIFRVLPEDESPGPTGNLCH